MYKWLLRVNAPPPPFWPVSSKCQWAIAWETMIHTCTWMYMYVIVYSVKGSGGFEVWYM